MMHCNTCGKKFHNNRSYWSDSDKDYYFQTAFTKCNSCEASERGAEQREKIRQTKAYKAYKNKPTT